MVLTDELRVVTKDIHDISDKFVHMKLLVAITDRQLYGQALLSFYYIYTQIETSMEKLYSIQELDPIQRLLPSLARASLLRIDLEFYLGNNWENKYKPGNAVRDYIKHLRKLENEEPLLLVVYCYHMYSAILAGGQIIKNMVIKGMNLPPGKGISVFQFPDDIKKNELKKEFRDAINSIEFEDKIKKKIILEAPMVFHRNNQVIKELNGAWQRFFRFIIKYTLRTFIFLLIAWWLIRKLT